MESNFFKIFLKRYLFINNPILIRRILINNPKKIDSEKPKNTE